MRRSKASSFFIMGSLLGCAAACRSGKPDDLTPRYLSSPTPQNLQAPPLTLRKRIVLRDCESLSMQYVLTVTPAEDGYDLFTSQGIGQIDSTGRLVRLLGDDLVKQRTLYQLGNCTWDQGAGPFHLCEWGRPRGRIVSMDPAGSIQDSVDLGFHLFELHVLPDGNWLLDRMTTEPHGVLVPDRQPIREAEYAARSVHARTVPHPKIAGRDIPDPEGSVELCGIAPTGQRVGRVKQHHRTSRRALVQRPLDPSRVPGRGRTHRSLKASSWPPFVAARAAMSAGIFELRTLRYARRAVHCQPGLDLGFRGCVAEIV